jgi:hypothetical protein
MLPFGVTIPATVLQGSEIPEGLMNNPVYWSMWYGRIWLQRYSVSEVLYHAKSNVKRIRLGLFERFEILTTVSVSVHLFWNETMSLSVSCSLTFQTIIVSLFLRGHKGQLKLHPRKPTTCVTLQFQYFTVHFISLNIMSQQMHFYIIKY